MNSSGDKCLFFGFFVKATFNTLQRPTLPPVYQINLLHGGLFWNHMGFPNQITLLKVSGLNPFFGAVILDSENQVIRCQLQGVFNPLDIQDRNFFGYQSGSCFTGTESTLVCQEKIRLVIHILDSNLLKDPVTLDPNRGSRKKAALQNRLSPFCILRPLACHDIHERPGIGIRVHRKSYTLTDSLDNLLRHGVDNSNCLKIP